MSTPQANAVWTSLTDWHACLTVHYCCLTPCAHKDSLFSIVPGEGPVIRDNMLVPLSCVQGWRVAAPATL